MKTVNQTGTLSISLTMDVDTIGRTLAAIQEAIAGTTEAPEATSHIDIGDIKKGRGRPAKTETVGETTDELDLEEEEETEEEETVTKAEVMSALRDFKKKHGGEKTMKLLKKFGVTNVNDLEASNYSAAIAAASK